PGPVSVDRRISQTMESAIQKTCETLNQIESRVTATKLAQASNFMIDEELYQLYQRVGSDRDLMLARAVCEQRVRPADLARHLSLSPDEVNSGLKELLRRRVISFESHG